VAGGETASLETLSYGLGPFEAARERGRYEYIDYDSRYQREPVAYPDRDGGWVLHLPLDAPDRAFPVVFVGGRRLLLCGPRRIIGFEAGWAFRAEMRKLARRGAPGGYLRVYTGERLENEMRQGDLAVARVRDAEELHSWFPKKIADQLSGVL